MNIPETAVDAVLDIIKERDAQDGTDRDFQDYVTIAVDIHEELTAAAPFIAAQALRDMDLSIVLEQFSPTDHGALIVVKEELRGRADELEAGK